jgi:hypothetical protein
MVASSSQYNFDCLNDLCAIHLSLFSLYSTLDKFI